MLKKVNRITKQKEFNRFFGIDFKKRGGINISSQDLILKILPIPESLNRFAFIISNKVDNKAVVRNKIKRRMRETIRLEMDKLQKGYEFLFIAKPTLKAKSNKEIELLVKLLLKKTNLLK